MTQTCATVHTAPWVLPGSAEPIRHGAVAVAGAHITAVGSLRDVLRTVGQSAPVIEWQGTLAPGLVNAHTHLQYTCMADLGRVSYEGFETWSDAFEVSYALPHDWRQSAEEGLQAAVGTGTTSIADVVTHVEALDVIHSGRVHGVAYWEVMAWLADDWVSRGQRETLEILHGTQTESIGVSPHSPYALDTEVLQDLGRLAAKQGRRSHLHLAESAWEAEFVGSGSGALADQWRDWGFSNLSLLRGGGTRLRPVAYADSIGALGASTHIAHGVYVDSDDRATLRRTGTVVALCPRSNAVLGLDEAPIADYLREGNLVSVGTDSLSSSPSLDVMADVEALYRIARRQGYSAPDLHHRLFHAVTAGGAAALGLTSEAARVGILDRGALADLVIFGTELPSAADTLAAIVETGAGQVTATVIAGEVRWQRTPCTADISSAGV